MSSKEDDDLAPTDVQGFKVGEKKTVEEYRQLGKLRFSSIDGGGFDLCVGPAAASSIPPWWLLERCTWTVEMCFSLDRSADLIALDRQTRTTSRYVDGRNR